MVKTRTQLLLKDHNEELYESELIENSESSDEENLPGDSTGYMVPYNRQGYEPPQELIDLVGGAVKMDQLMKCVESFGQSEMYYRIFRNLYSSEAEKDSLITKLRSNAYFFESFVQSKPTKKKFIGEVLFYNQYAVHKFCNGREKLDLENLLRSIDPPEDIPESQVTVFKLGDETLRVRKIDKDLEALIQDSLRNVRVVYLKRRFSEYYRKVLQDYTEFLFRLADKEIPTEWHKPRGYNLKVSAARKKARQEREALISNEDSSTNACEDESRTPVSKKQKQIQKKKPVHNVKKRQRESSSKDIADNQNVVNTDLDGDDDRERNTVDNTENVQEITDEIPTTDEAGTELSSQPVEVRLCSQQENISDTIASEQVQISSDWIIRLSMQYKNLTPELQYKLVRTIDIFFQNNENETVSTLGSEENSTSCNTIINDMPTNEQEHNTDKDTDEEILTPQNILTNISDHDLSSNELINQDTVENVQIPVSTSNSPQTNNSIATNTQQLANVSSETITTPRVGTLNNSDKQTQQSVGRPRRKNSTYAGAIINVKLRDRENCKILQTTFFSCANKRPITRGTNNERIKLIRPTIHGDRLESNELDAYINNINNKNKTNNQNDVIILNSDFFTMALRCVQSQDAESTERFAMPQRNNVHTMIGELINKIPLVEPYNEENEQRCRDVWGLLPQKEDYKNFQKIMYPINLNGHWMLVVISIKYRLILFCDSIKTSKIPDGCIENTVSFLRYYYPDIREEEWQYDNLNDSDRFQNPELNLDCGFHIINFMRAAIQNIRTPIMHAEFNIFKTRTLSTIDILLKRNNLIDLSTSDSNKQVDPNGNITLSQMVDTAATSNSNTQTVPENTTTPSQIVNTVTESNTTQSQIINPDNTSNSNLHTIPESEDVNTSNTNCVHQTHVENF